VLFTSDAWPIIFMMLFAFSNGYVASLLMMYGPSQVEPENAEPAGTMMVRPEIVVRHPSESIWL